MNTDVLKNHHNNPNKSVEKNNAKPKTTTVVEKTLKEANNSLVVISPKNVSENQKEEIFWGHFDLNMSRSVEGDNFSKSSSISMSIDIFGYNKNGISDENKENLSDLFNGKDFEELRDSFFSLNGSEEGIEGFSSEIDDLFGKISETLDMDEKLLEGPKKLLKFTAIMFSNNLNINKDTAEAEIDEPSHNAITDTLATTAKLYGILGDTTNMNKKASEAMLLEPSNTIKEYLSDMTEKYSLGNEDHSNDLYKTLNRLSKLSQKFNHFLN